MIFFRKKMEMIAEKIEAATLNKTNLIEIFSVGKKIHDVIRQCSENCTHDYLVHLSGCFNLFGQ